MDSFKLTNYFHNFDLKVIFKSMKELGLTALKTSIHDGNYWDEYYISCMYRLCFGQTNRQHEMFLMKILLDQTLNCIFGACILI